MKNIKIIYFDIDGTMIDMEKKVMSETMINTLNQLKQNGIKICVATGRPPLSLPKFDVEFDAYMTFNGSYCYANNDIIYKNPIPKEDVLTIIKNAKQISRPVTISSSSRIGANGYDKDLDDYFSIANQKFIVSDNFEELLEEDIYQLMIGGNDEVYQTVLKDTINSKAVAWWHRATDIIPNDAGKGIGVQKINDYFGFTKEQSIAFGDGGNDIEMLEAVGKGIAMGNATDNVKKIADEICDTVSNEGITKYCKNMNLI